jgi:hypothetical protein
MNKYAYLSAAPFALALGDSLVQAGRNNGRRRVRLWDSHDDAAPAGVRRQEQDEEER